MPAGTAEGRPDRTYSIRPVGVVREAELAQFLQPFFDLRHQLPRLRDDALVLAAKPGNLHRRIRNLHRDSSLHPH